MSDCVHTSPARQIEVNRKVFHNLKKTKKKTCVLAVRHCPPSTASLQNNASKLLLAIMESRHDSENAERILYNMRPKELVRMRRPLVAVAPSHAEAPPPTVCLCRRWR